MRRDAPNPNTDPRRTDLPACEVAADAIIQDIIEGRARR